jgi:hypothetical protein
MAPALGVMLFLAVSMLLIFCKIRDVEANSMRFVVWSGHLQWNFARKSMAYVGAMFVTWGFYVTTFIYWKITNGDISWWLSFLGAFLLPVQGALNAAIYFHKPRQRPALSTSDSNPRFFPFSNRRLMPNQRDSSQQPQSQQQQLQSITPESSETSK